MPRKKTTAARLEADVPEVLTAAYEPTEKEAAALAAQQERTRTRGPRPKMKTKVTTATDDNGHTVAHAKYEVDHADSSVGSRLLDASLGSTDWNFSRLMLAHLAGLSSPKETLEAGKTRDDKALAGHLAIVQAVEPQNEIECMLAVQMAAVHSATMHMASNMRAATNVQQAEAHERSMNRLARTFTTQLEALKKAPQQGRAEGGGGTSALSSGARRPGGLRRRAVQGWGGGSNRKGWSIS